MSVQENKVVISARKTPLLFSKSSLYRLSDFSYGEWIVFEKGEPKYYLYIFDSIYSSVIDKLRLDVEKYLRRIFTEKGLSLSTHEATFRFPLESKSSIVELHLKKLPLNYIY